VINHRLAGKAASIRGLELRYGSFCNRGGLKAALKAAHGNCHELLDPCWLPGEVQNKSRSNLNGALRVSFGFASSFDHVQSLVNFIKDACACQDVKSFRRKFWEEQAQETCRKKRDRDGEDPAQGRDIFCKRVKLVNQVALAPVASTFPEPGGKDALPSCCGTLEERVQAALSYPDACAAVRAQSLPALCWYLHDQRHKYSVEEEFLHRVFVDEVQGRTVLMVASAMGLLDFVDILLDVLGADVNHASSTDGDTALHRAACKGHPDVCKRLLTAGANVKQEIKSGPLAGWTAKQVAAWKSSGDRCAHPKAHLANYHPAFGGAFDEAAAVLQKAEQATCQELKLELLPNADSKGQCSLELLSESKAAS